MSTATYLVALAGNPNVGKSTVFNALTGLNQHTGNWPGKTVGLFEGTVSYKDAYLRFVDLPGTYSLRANSPEEEVARDFIVSEKPDVTVCIIDATCLERNLNLVLQVMPLAKRCVVCLNLMDEAASNGIEVDVCRLQSELGVPVIATSARKGEGMDRLLESVYLAARDSAGTDTAAHAHRPLSDEAVEEVFRRAEAIASGVVVRNRTGKPTFTDRLDSIVTSRLFGIPIMLLMLGTVFAITISLANYPSMALSWVLFSLEDKITSLMLDIGTPGWLHGLLIYGCYRTVAWVVSVMLPPMAIFFPLFTLLEDFGYLPRVAFNLDHLFRKSGGHGKQALTMSMGFGCNAAGVVAARIIESPRERLIAILTNCFVPCNGRFPTLIMISAIFFRGPGRLGSLGPSIAVMGIIIIGIVITLAASRILTATALKGVSSSFVLELPPYRKPDVLRVLARSWKDRTVWVLRRAVAVAIPCGMLTWLVANVNVGGASILAHAAGLLNPFARLLGMDGTILTAFILGFPANEIVLPIALMGYLSQGTMIEVESIDVMGSILRSNGWGWTTGLSVLLFSLLHFPCGTTVYSVYKETGSAKWTLMSFLIPTAAACLVLLVLNAALRLVGI
jgi:ferrous iron transport protein B